MLAQGLNVQQLEATMLAVFVAYAMNEAGPIRKKEKTSAQVKTTTGRDSPLARACQCV